MNDFGVQSSTSSYLDESYSNYVESYAFLVLNDLFCRMLVPFAYSGPQVKAPEQHLVYSQRQKGDLKFSV